MDSSEPLLADTEAAEDGVEDVFGHIAPGHGRQLGRRQPEPGRDGVVPGATRRSAHRRLPRAVQGNECSSHLMLFFIFTTSRAIYFVFHSQNAHQSH